MIELRGQERNGIETGTRAVVVAVGGAHPTRLFAYRPLFRVHICFDYAIQLISKKDARSD